MEARENFGSKRLIVGAHYGVIDFIIQRLTAVILSVYMTTIFAILAVNPNLNYEKWKSFFTFQVFVFPLGRIFAVLAFIALICHAWVGIRDVWMDYVKLAGMRLTLQVLTILWLLGSIIYFLQILWSI